MAAAWFGLRGTFLTAGAVSSVFMIHILLDWGGYRMAQADQVGEIASFWVIALTSSLLFDRERRALAETAAAHEETLAALASSLDLREHETSLHSRRVREYPPDVVDAFLKIPFRDLAETASGNGVVLSSP